MSNYIVDQYNHFKSVDSRYMTRIGINASAGRRSPVNDTESVYSRLYNNIKDECVWLGDNNKFDTKKVYYFHGKIRYILSDQIFNIKLCYYSPSTTEEGSVTQFIKTITVVKGNPSDPNSDWYDVEFVFTPLENFDCILFELRREVDDFKDGTRYPIIIYKELSEINNFIPSLPGTPQSLIKLGVQTRPSLSMCINQEEIKVGSSGVYEMKNGLITADFFSIVGPGILGKNEEETDMEVVMKQYMQAVNTPGPNYGGDRGENYYNPEKPNNTGSQCYFGYINDANRVIDGYTLDYMYLNKT